MALPQSAGELENDEHTAGVMMQMVRTASRFRLPGSAEQPPFKRMSGKYINSGKHSTGDPELTWRLFPLLSDPGGLCVHGDGLWSEGVCGETTEQPAGANQCVETQVEVMKVMKLQLGVRSVSNSVLFDLHQVFYVWFCVFNWIKWFKTSSSLIWTFFPNFNTSLYIKSTCFCGSLEL